MLRAAALALLALVPLLLAAECEPPPDDKKDAGPETCPFGDPSLPIEIELVARTVDGEAVALAEGDAVPLILPPQGGKVVLLGVRAKNVDACGVQLFASMNDECTKDPNDPDSVGRAIGLEGRPVRLEPRDDGWAWPAAEDELTNYANIPACPGFASSRDIDDEPYLVRARLTERFTNRRAEITLHVVPFCAEADQLSNCTCTCDKDYVLGDDCSLGGDDDVGDPEPGVCFATPPP